MCRGVHWAITKARVANDKTASNDAGRVRRSAAAEWDLSLCTSFRNSWNERRKKRKTWDCKTYISKFLVFTR